MWPRKWKKSYVDGKRFQTRSDYYIVNELIDATLRQSIISSYTYHEFLECDSQFLFVFKSFFHSFPHPPHFLLREAGMSQEAISKINFLWKPWKSNILSQLFTLLSSKMSHPTRSLTDSTQDTPSLPGLSWLNHLSLTKVPESCRLRPGRNDRTPISGLHSEKKELVSIDSHLHNRYHPRHPVSSIINNIHYM